MLVALYSFGGCTTLAAAPKLGTATAEWAPDLAFQLGAAAGTAARRAAPNSPPSEGKAVDIWSGVGMARGAANECGAGT